MKRKVYLVDTENVGIKWISILSNIQEHDKILLFYTPNSGKYALDEVEQLLKYKNNVSCVKCFNGHANALDFQLTSMVGYFAHAEPENEFIIVSNDTGYDSMIKFLCGMDLKVSRLPIKMTVSSVTEHIEVNKQVNVLISNNTVLTPQHIHDALRCPLTDSVWILDLLMKNRTLSRSQVHNHLVSHFGNKKGRDYYSLLKKSGILKHLKL